MRKSKTVTIDIFGGCPRCGRITGHCEAEYTHWGYCDRHKLTWASVCDLRDADERSISETEVRGAWRESRRFLAGFEQVRGVPQGTWPRDERAREEAVAAYQAEQKAGREAGEALFDRLEEALAPLAAALAARKEATIEITVDSQHLRCSKTYKIARGHGLAESVLTAAMTKALAEGRNGQEQERAPSSPLCQRRDRRNKVSGGRQ